MDDEERRLLDGRKNDAVTAQHVATWGIALGSIPAGRSVGIHSTTTRCTSKSARAENGRKIPATADFMSSHA
jgi:hypothetical protein